MLDYAAYLLATTATSFVTEITNNFHNSDEIVEGCYSSADTEEEPKSSSESYYNVM